MPGGGEGADDPAFRVADGLRDELQDSGWPEAAASAAGVQFVADVVGGRSGLEDRPLTPAVARGEDSTPRRQEPGADVRPGGGHGEGRHSRLVRGETGRRTGLPSR